MGILTEYFAAIPERAQAAVQTGPGDELAPLRCKNVEPTVLGGALWEAVRHGGPDESAGDLSADAERVDGNDDEGPFLLRLESAFVAELAVLPDDRVEPVAARWATAEEWVGDIDPEILAEIVVELRRVARQALADGVDAYCWLCL
ncbi:hypothetical protein [Micromonospora sp. NPDC005806]|uniref:hypothetical protein n=1 Tax=Micromonospora sp. NPDC005806 TaxID=3364234 RepID=UPI0036C912DA